LRSASRSPTSRRTTDRYGSIRQNSLSDNSARSLFGCFIANPQRGDRRPGELAHASSFSGTFEARASFLDLSDFCENSRASGRPEATIAGFLRIMFLRNRRNICAYSLSCLTRAGARLAFSSPIEAKHNPVVTPPGAPLAQKSRSFRNWLTSLRGKSLRYSCAEPIYARCIELQAFRARHLDSVSDVLITSCTPPTGRAGEYRLTKDRRHGSAKPMRFQYGIFMQ
jgi:hypothetical protein